MSESTPILPAAIRRVPLFAAMGDRELTTLLEATSPIELEAGDILFRRGDPGAAVFLVESGLLDAVIDEGTSSERVLSTFGPGDFFGEMALLTGERRSATIRAARSSRLLYLSKSRFDQLLETSPSLGLGLSRVLSQRLAETNQQLSRRGAFVSALVTVEDPLSAEALLPPLVASLGRQIDGDVALVLLAVPLPAWIGSGASATDLDEATEQLEDMPGGGRWLHLGADLLARTADGQVAGVLSELRRRFGHVLVWTTASYLAHHTAALARSDRVCLVADGPAAGAVLDQAIRDTGVLGLVARGRVRLAQIGRQPRHAQLVRSAGLRPIRIGVETDDRGAGHVSEGDVDRLARALAGKAVGLALSGGAAQGVAHLGVMEGLLGAGIPIDLIAGTSGGALYGSLVASGMPVRRAQAVVIRQTRRNLNDRADFTIPTRGLIAGRRIAAMVREALGDITFDDLMFPLYAVATDLDSGEEVVIDEGPVYRAVRASISVPGVFEPYRLGGRLLVDGGVINPMPVSVARRKGADFVIAVQVPAPGKASKGSEPYVSRQLGTSHHLLSIMVRTYYFAGDELAKRGASEADILIRPPVAHFGWRDYRSAPEIIRCGYRAAQEAAERIRAARGGATHASQATPD